MAGGGISIGEDERVVAFDLEDRLVRMGCVVAGAAANGRAAIDQARAQAPDLVLTNAELAGEMDGIEAAVQNALHRHAIDAELHRGEDR